MTNLDNVIKQEYPDSLIDALITKGFISEYKNKLTKHCKIMVDITLNRCILPYIK